MKLRLFCAVLLPLALLAQNPQPPKPNVTVTPIGQVPIKLPPKDVAADAVVLVIGDVKFTREQFEFLIQKGMAQRVSQTDRRKMAISIANFITLADEARREGLDQTPSAKMNLQIVTDQWLAQQVINKEVREKPVDDAVLRAYYDKNHLQFDQVKAKHILIRFKGSRVPLRPGQKDLSDEEALAKAQEIKKKVDAGADFAELAKTESDDTGTAKTGGDLGVFTHGRMVPEFEQAAFGAEVGKVTDPVKTPFGYHLILVSDHKPQPFDQAKVEIEHKLRPELEQQYVESVRTRTPVTIDKTYFGEMEPPLPTPPSLTR